MINYSWQWFSIWMNTFGVGDFFALSFYDEKWCLLLLIFAYFCTEGGLMSILMALIGPLLLILVLRLCKFFFNLKVVGLALGSLCQDSLIIRDTEAKGSKHSQRSGMDGLKFCKVNKKNNVWWTKDFTTTSLTFLQMTASMSSKEGSELTYSQYGRAESSQYSYVVKTNVKSMQTKKCWVLTVCSLPVMVLRQISHMTRPKL